MTDSLGDRMKDNYENRSKTFLTRRMPVIVRLDGRSFHTFTRNFYRPFDEVLHTAMNETTRYLCKNIMGCKIGYTQSDEITLLLTDYDTLTTEAWFNYNVQKLCSIIASMATFKFNQVFKDIYIDWCKGEYKSYKPIYEAAINKGAVFDCRCFNIPKEEVCNCFIWRQQDCIRNAVQLVGQHFFSSKDLYKKPVKNIIEKLNKEKDFDFFTKVPIEYQNGVCCIRQNTKKEIEIIGIMGKMVKIIQENWILDLDVPIFSADREYIECYI